jgi:AraC-like DNA-binding protein
MPLESQPIIVQIGENTHGGKKDDIFCLPDFWTLHLYAYEAQLEVDSHVFPIRPGYIGINPPGSRQIYHYLGRSPHLFAHFSIATVGPTYSVPAMLDLKQDYQAMEESFREAIRFWSINRRRSTVRLWDILWQTADVSAYESAENDIPEVVHRIASYIDTHLHEPMNVAQLAAEQGISHNHCTRLFRSSKGQTPLDYIQKRRVAQAKHLLIYSSLPIKVVAASIGISDPQIFNKFIRHYLGRAPKELREWEQPNVGLVERI